MSWASFRNIFRLIVLGGLLGAVLAACAPQQTRGICPRVAILAQTSRVTSFAEGTPRTEQNVRYVAELSSIEIDCRYTDQSLYVLEADVILTMNVRRGPALQGNTAPVSYFVAVTDRRGNVLTKRVFNIDVDMNGQEQVSVIERTFHEYRMRRAGSGTLYETWAGFQMTDEQLEYARQQRASGS
jgi:hypothetical protein